MEWHEQNLGAVTVFKPVGALISDAAAHFRGRAMEVAAANLGRIVLDGAGIPYVDSRGIEALIEVTEELGLSGRSLKLCAINPLIREVLELTGWADAFEYFSDVNTGVRSFL
ncbi:MAG: STAS domain-containing protein [Phycisphaerae bacterium]|nr:STAS domain-containing protein [Phycisphaerae bacterium]